MHLGLPGLPWWQRWRWGGGPWVFQETINRGGTSGAVPEPSW